MGNYELLGSDTKCSDVKGSSKPLKEGLQNKGCGDKDTKVKGSEEGPPDGRRGLTRGWGLGLLLPEQRGATGAPTGYQAK